MQTAVQTQMNSNTIHASLQKIYIPRELSIRY